MKSDSGTHQAGASRLPETRLGEQGQRIEAEPAHVVIVQCTGDKRDGTHAARVLYDESDYFVKQRAYAEAVADYWFIQSAKYGLVHPNTEIEYYNKHAKHIDEPKTWAAEIVADLDVQIPDGARVDVLGGKDYADPLTPELEALGYEVHEPLRGQRIGTRKRSLAQMANTKLEVFA